MTQTKTKIFRLQILSEEIVRNPNISCNAFIAFAQLHKLASRKGKFDVQFDHTNMRSYLGLSDNRTLRKVFDNLYENNLIIEPILKFPNRSAMTVSLNPEYAISSNTRAFTQLDARVFNKSILAHIGATGVRMLYYYQSRINYKSLSTDHCFAAVKTIAKEIGVSKETVIKYNEILESTKLIKIIKHKLDWSGGYNEFGFEDYTRYNNHTYINEENIPKLLVELSKTSEF